MAVKAKQFDPRQHMQRDTYEIFRYKDNYLKNVELHHHDFYEVYFFLSGNVQYNIESRSYLLAPGDVLLISPLELHQPVFGQGRRSYERMVLWINKDFLEQLSGPEQDLSACFDPSAPGRTNLLRLEDPMRQMLTFQLEQLIQEVESEEYCAQTAALTYLVQVLVLLNRQMQHQYQQAQMKPFSNSPIYQILNYINNHYSEDLTLDCLANRFFMSKYHLSREFQRLVGTTVHRYLTQKRLVMAKQMIREGASATEVCQHCGFGDYSNFYRAFKAEYQISPREFSQRLKNALPASHLPAWPVR